MEVHVLIYEDRLGLDVSVHRRREAAVGACATIARKWWEEARDVDPALSERPPAADEEAIARYFGAQEGVEYQAIYSCQVRDESLGTRLAAAFGRLLVGEPSAERAAAIASLYRVAREGELALLDELMERAGEGYVCRREDCGFVNVGAVRCGACGASAPEERSDASVHS